MARINLLPWREELRQAKQKQYITQLIATALTGVAIVIGTHVAISQQIDNQIQRNDRLKTEIKLVDKRLQEIKEIESLKKALVDRMGVIQKLQESRPEVVHLLDDMVTTLPDGLYLTSMKQRGNALSIDGKAESNARVSTYMRNLNNSPWLDNAKLLFIEAKQEKQNDSTKNSPDNIRSFALQVTQVNSNTGAEGEK